MKNSVITPEETINDDEINLLHYWRIIVKRKKIIGIIAGVAFVGSIIYSLTLPKIYASTANIFPPQQEGSMAGIASQSTFVNNVI